MEKKNYLNSLYDTLAQECGEVVSTDETVQTVSGDDLNNELKKVDKATNHYAYGDTGPVPGDSISSFLDNTTEVKKDDAVQNMIRESALLKAQQEAEDEKKSRTLTKEEKAQRKKQLVEYLLYQQEEAYFAQNHYIMDGKTKRRTRKIIERNYDKGKYGDMNSTASLND